MLKLHQLTVEGSFALIQSDMWSCNIANNLNEPSRSFQHYKRCRCIYIKLYITRSPAGAGIANRPLVFLGIFLIFGSNTPTWSVENQLNLWAKNCVVNQTGYLGPLYASRHQTSLWRHRHIYSVQLPQTGWLSGRVSDLRSKGRRFEPRP